MRTIILAAAAVAATLSAAPAAMAQSERGLSGTLDQLNRAVNPNSYQTDRDTRYEGSSRSDREASGSSGSRSAYQGQSDREIRNRYDRVLDEQRQIQKERRALEAEMDSRGLN